MQGRLTAAAICPTESGRRSVTKLRKHAKNSAGPIRFITTRSQSAQAMP
jgi:hypothetical protein